MFKIFIVFLMISVIYSNNVFAVSEPEAPTELTIKDVPNDNGHWIIVKFKTPPQHLTSVKSYQLYRLTPIGADSTWVYTAVFPSTLYDKEGFSSALAPTPVNGDFWWGLCASDQDVTSDIAVAEKPVVYISEMSNIYLGGAIDNISPSPFIAFSIQLNEKNVILLNWQVPEDHGIVGYYGWAGVGQH
ncbi:MAG: hypothetical protein ABFD66_12955, partial [Smithella sp.]